ncbi:unnamed protein product [Soboliphyme baturini]|uniref:Uncharacterized protein n=1 Tax=Soboliphyme baturini TaxID=241478 RepID=A0A183J6F2_9BILA|nr:unnamed protein product [Soboliphyme baturini]
MEPDDPGKVERGCDGLLRSTLRHNASGRFEAAIKMEIIKDKISTPKRAIENILWLR